jgi:hypothetical protein
MQLKTAISAVLILLLSAQAFASDCKDILDSGSPTNGQVLEAVRCLAEENAALKKAALENENQGMVAFFAANQCPSGWERYDKGRGRYLVGVNDASSKALGESIGIELRDNENRPSGAHTHLVNTFAVGREGYDGNALVYAYPGHGGYERTREDVSTTKSRAAEKELPEGTNAPYVMLLSCKHK